MIRRPPSSPLFPYTPLFRSLVELGLPLGDARTPGGFPPRLRRAADPLSMADVARLLEELRTVLWHRGGDRRARRPALGIPLRRLDGERRVVAPGNRLFYGRTDARVHVLAVFGVAQHLQVLG